MEAGSLRHFITIESPTETQDLFGEPTATWDTFNAVWASREDLDGQEWFVSQQPLAKHTTRFVIRYVAGLSAKMRLVSGGVVYNILSSADPDGKRRTLTIMTTREG